MTADDRSSEARGTPDVDVITKKYAEEREKRFRPDGSAQYIELAGTQSAALADLVKDPWVDHGALNAQPPNLTDGDEIKILILGCGFSGLLHAVHQVEAGIDANDIRLVDTAGGFGGTWYWNRYPGIMVDVEGSIYLPLLEKTGYMPKNRFPYGPEIRQHILDIAERWNLSDKGVFRTQARTYDWIEEDKRWKVLLTQDRGPDQPSIDMTITAQFVILAGGVLNHPKIPKIPGLDSFSGHMMHTSRWKYDISGGSPDDWTLSGLQRMKVGIVGTGATAVQCVPEVARWAERLYVFQRTPSSVDERGQQPIDPQTWQHMAGKEGWWRARNENWCGRLAGHAVGSSMIQDRWSESTAYKHITGGQHAVEHAVEHDVEHAVEHDVEHDVEHTATLLRQALADDAPRAERVRQRVDDTITDSTTAAALKAWYPIWCKRPCFHDDYLAAFNLAHVRLVDTNATGIQAVTAAGIVAGDTQYDLDLIIWSTGFRSPFANLAEPSHNADTSVTARGNSLARLWRHHGPTTLHGILTPWMPNLLLAGPSQTAGCANFMYLLDALARHGAYIVARVLRRASNPARATVHASPDAAEAWARRILSRAGFRSPLAVCGPSYFNGEGATRNWSAEESAKAARGAIYPLGILAYVDILEQWRAQDQLGGLEVV